MASSMAMCVIPVRCPAKGPRLRSRRARHLSAAHVVARHRNPRLLQASLVETADLQIEANITARSRFYRMHAEHSRLRHEEGDLQRRPGRQPRWQIPEPAPVSYTHLRAHETRHDL